MSELRNARNNLEESILKQVSDKNIGDKTVQLSDGKLRFTQTRVAEPLTFKYLEKTLGQVVVHDEHAKKILDHLKSAREFKTVSSIKRVVNTVVNTVVNNTTFSKINT